MHKLSHRTCRAGAREAGGHGLADLSDFSQPTAMLPAEPQEAGADAPGPTRVT